MNGGSLGGVGGHTKGVSIGVHKGSSPWAAHHTVAVATVAAKIAITLGGVHTGESAKVSAFTIWFRFLWTQGRKGTLWLRFI